MRTSRTPNLQIKDQPILHRYVPSGRRSALLPVLDLDGYTNKLNSLRARPLRSTRPDSDLSSPAPPHQHARIIACVRDIRACVQSRLPKLTKQNKIQQTRHRHEHKRRDSPDPTPAPWGGPCSTDSIQHIDHVMLQVHGRDSPRPRENVHPAPMIATRDARCECLGQGVRA